MSEFKDWFRAQFPGYSAWKLTEGEITNCCGAIDIGDRCRSRLEQNDRALEIEDAARKAWLAGFDAGRQSK